MKRRYWRLLVFLADCVMVYFTAWQVFWTHKLFWQLAGLLLFCVWVRWTLRDWQLVFQEETDGRTG